MSQTEGKLRTTFLVHQKPHAAKQKAVVERIGDEKVVANKLVKSNKHTRRTFAGKYDPETRILLIGIAGNHLSDAFVKSVGSEIARERVDKPSKYLQAQKKQLLIRDVAPEEVSDTFFKTIEELKN